MDKDYQLSARKLDTKPHGLPIPAEQRRRGLIGPVLTTLRQFESVRGILFGTYAESSRDVQRLMEIAAEAHRLAARRGLPAQCSRSHGGCRAEFAAAVTDE